jgi:predicted nucleotidyltransferase component of viral defense system
MRRYASPAAFRAAVEARLRARARRLGVEAYVLRRQAALERLLARISKTSPGRWAVKGGLALEVRLGEHARPSLDLDADHVQGAEAAREDIRRAAAEDLGDNFAFTITGREELREGGLALAVRYRIESSLAGAFFEPLQVDVTTTPPDPWDAEPAQRPGLLADVGLGPVDLLVIPLERQIAEKLHAYTRLYDRGTTRAKDLVDFLLIRSFAQVDARRLKDAIRRTFERRGTHAVPARLPPPPRDLAVPYRREAKAAGVVTSLEEAHRLTAEWLDPVLTCAARGIWDPRAKRWTG